MNTNPVQLKDKYYDIPISHTGDVPLKFIITTMPPWPGASEANCQ